MYKTCFLKVKPCFNCKYKGNHHSSIVDISFPIKTLPQNNMPESNFTVGNSPTPNATRTTQPIVHILLNGSFQKLETKLWITTVTVQNPIIKKSCRTRLILDCASNKTHITQKISTSLIITNNRYRRTKSSSFWRNKIETYKNKNNFIQNHTS